MLQLSQKLRVYIAVNDVAKNHFATLTDVAPETVSNWLHHNKRPNRKNALAIRDATAGFITLQDMGYDE